jgi:hypothetical protein
MCRELKAPLIDLARQPRPPCLAALTRDRRRNQFAAQSSVLALEFSLVHGDPPSRGACRAG